MACVHVLRNGDFGNYCILLDEALLIWEARIVGS